MTVAHGLLVPVPTSTSPSEPRPVADLTYEQAREELVTVVQRLEAGGETLEGSLALWERGEALATRCQEWLDGARRRLEEAHAATSGTTADPRAARGGTTPADADPEDEDAR